MANNHTSRPRRVAVAVVVGLFVLAASASGPSAARAAPSAARCSSIVPARVSRVGDHWLLLGTQRNGRSPTDARVGSLGLTLLDERDGKVVAVEIPVAPLRSSLRPATAGGPLAHTSRKGVPRDAFTLRLVHVDTTGQRFTLSVDYRGRVQDKVAGTRYTLARWRRGANAFRLSAPIQILAPKARGFAVHVGLDGRGDDLVLLSESTKVGLDRVSRAVAVVRVSAADGVVSRVISFTTPARKRGAVGGRTRLSKDRTLLAIPEYIEATTSVGAVHIVDVTKGTRVTVPAMATVYGLDFSPDNTRLALGSNRLARLEVWDIATQKRLRSGQGVKRLHRLVYGAAGKTLWAAGKGGEVASFDAQSLRRRGKAWRPTAKVAGGLYAQLKPRPAGAPQTFGFTADPHGLGLISSLCVGVSLP